MHRHLTLPALESNEGRDGPAMPVQPSSCIGRQLLCSILAGHAMIYSLFLGRTPG
jgi:hypothetical protein